MEQSYAIATLVLIIMVLVVMLFSQISKRQKAESERSYTKRDLSDLQERFNKLNNIFEKSERDMSALRRKSEESMSQLQEKVGEVHSTEEKMQKLYQDLSRHLYPDLSLMFDFDKRQKNYEADVDAVRKVAEEGIARWDQAETALKDSEEKGREMAAQIQALQSEVKRHRENVGKILESHLTSMPWLAGMMADFLTYDLEVEAKKLDWGSNVQREKKIASIRAIRAETQERIAKSKEAIYQLEYLRELFPGIDDVLDTNYQELSLAGEVPDHDPVRDYLSREEWARLSDVERNQLALDRYVASHQKSNWQIGRDYELAVAYEYSQKDYQVDTFGSYMGLEDLGRDFIAKKGASTLIIQCKYWSKSKTIHEKHIYQLYGTMIGYCVEKNIPPDRVAGVFVTNIQLSDMARKIADYLGLAYAERHPMAAFPRIKCNIGRDEYGQTRIFHLPMDQQYDATKISGPGEFYAFTVQEAVDAGFRRAFKWHGGG